MNVTPLHLLPLALMALIALQMTAPDKSSDPFVPAALAQSGDVPQQGQRGGPPPDAFDACATKAQSDVCNFAIRNGTGVTGTCQQPLLGRPTAMACVPEDAIPKG